MRRGFGIKMRTLIFGTGTGGVNFYKSCRDRQKVIGFLDNNPQKHGQLLFGKTICAPEQLTDLSFDKIIIASDYHHEIKKQLMEEFAINEDKITVYWPSQANPSRLQFLRQRVELLRFELICKRTGLVSDKTLRALIEAVATSKGIGLAASEPATHCLRISSPADTVTVSLRTMRDWAQRTGLTLLEVGEVEKIPFKAPHVWGCPATTETTLALSNKPYVADIAGARIFGNSSIILTSDGTAISDTGGHPKFGRFVSFIYEPVVLAQQPDKVILSFGKFETREIEAGIFLSGLASNAFGHWLPEFLPKLQFLQQHPDFANLPLIVDADMPQSHFDHLRRLSDNPLILLRTNESLICRRLLVAPSPAFLPTEFFANDIPVSEMPGLSPRALRFIRGDQSLYSKVRREKRIFLARKNMKWRRLLNEKEIEIALSDFGFETVFTEDMTVQEQIDMFQKAEWIVAPNGSALLNLIFADPGAKLLVLTQPNLHNWGTFQGPMESLGYSPLWVSGDYVHVEDQKHSHYQVPVDRVFEALSFLGLNGIKN
jgi:hypothetical protein